MEGEKGYHWFLTGYVVPRRLGEPGAGVVHLSLVIEDDAPLQEKVVFVDVQFSGRLENLAAHLKSEE